MYSNSSSNLSAETSSESLSLYEIKATILHLNDKLGKLAEDILFFKTTQDTDQSSCQRDCLITQQEIKALKADVKAFAMIISPITLQINQSLQGLSSFKFTAITNSNTIEDVMTIDTPLTLIKGQVMKTFQEKSLQIETLRFSNERLKMINDVLGKDIYNMEKATNEKVQCVNCNLSFFLKDNKHKENCLYHPGEIKYYSCKGCGKDEYYTCCLKCTECAKGCKLGKHIKLV